MFFNAERGRFVFEGKRGPLVGIRGWLGRWSSSGLRKYMSEQNVEGILLDFGLQTKEVDKYVKQLNEELSPFSRTIVVGYSMGGVIAMRYLQTYGSSKINRLITVGSPFNGVGMLRLFDQFGDVYKDLAPSSKLLEELKNLKTPRVEVLNIFASYDQFVGDPNSISVPGKKIVLPVVGHNNLMNNVKWIAPFLDESLN